MFYLLVQEAVFRKKMTTKDILTRIIIICVLTALLTDANGQKWQDYEGYSYLFINTMYNKHMTWYEADEFCRNKSSILATIPDKEVNAFIKSALEPPLDTSYWIGLNSLNINGVYQWLDLSPTGYTEWNKTRENIFSTEREKCVQYDGKTGTWTDVNCLEWSGAICRKKIGTDESFPPLPSLPTTGNCLADWYNYGPYCYKFYNDEARSWKDAQTACRSNGVNFDLASIHDKQQQTLLTSMLKNDTWIGGTSMKKGNGPVWSDNSKFDYKNLIQTTSKINWKNKCIQMTEDHFNAGKWDLKDCQEEKPYVCQTFINELINVGPTVTPEKCQNDKYKYVGYEDDCYMIIEDLKTWTNAEQICEKTGAHLASISTPYENAFVNFLSSSANADVWIGLKEEEGSYKWLDTWPLYFTNWMDGQPKTKVEEISSCGLIDKDSLQWKVAPCKEEHNFICKLSDADPPEIEEFKGSCPAHARDWKDFEGLYCYRIYESKNGKSWPDAAKECLKYKAKLASFHSVHEMQVIRPFLNNMKAAWIGLHLIHDQTYEWHDESPVDFVMWEEDSARNGECVSMTLPNLFWKTEQCQTAKAFICAIEKVPEKKIEATKPPVATDGLGKGAVAAIVIVVLVTVGIIAGVLYWQLVHKRRIVYK